MQEDVLEFEFSAPRKIAFGWGRFRDVGELSRPLGRRAFVVTGARSAKESGLLEELTSLLRRAEVEAIVVGGSGREPTIEDVDACTAKIREASVGPGDFVAAVGGGSALDLGKGAAALAPQSAAESVREYLEGVGRGLKLVEAPLPMIAIPTTAGTGSEATRNAVVSCSEPKAKKSLRDDRMTPVVALIDPELTVGAPVEVAVRTNLDALTQLIEAYISRKAKPMARALALEGLRRAGRALAPNDDVSDRRIAEDMSYAATLSGMALANSGLGMAHGVAAALGVHVNAPHGLACAVMLPTALRVNRDKCWDSLADVGTALTGKTWPTRAAAARAGMQFVDRLLEELEIPTRLSALGVREEQLDDLVRDSKGNSMSGNPVELRDEELREILEAML